MMIPMLLSNFELIFSHRCVINWTQQHREGGGGGGGGERSVRSRGTRRDVGRGPPAPTRIGYDLSEELGGDDTPRGDSRQRRLAKSWQAEERFVVVASKDCEGFIRDPSKVEIPIHT